MIPNVQPLAIDVDAKRRVSALLLLPAPARACFVLGHGASAGMSHSFIADVAEGLAERGIATLRYQFPYMEQGLKRPDVPAVAHATVRAAVLRATALVPGLPLVAGGKSFGARMTSQAQSASPLPGVRGLAFLGFPLHEPGNPSSDRAAHLEGVQVPMLFLQGTRDRLAQVDLIQAVVDRLGARATLMWFEQADHSFHVPKSSGKSDADVIGQLAEALARWIDAVAS